MKENQDFYIISSDRLWKTAGEAYERYCVGGITWDQRPVTKNKLLYLHFESTCLNYFRIIMKDNVLKCFVLLKYNGYTLTIYFKQ